MKEQKNFSGLNENFASLDTLIKKKKKGEEAERNAIAQLINHLTK